MSFAHPHILWLLLVFPPAMLAFFWWSWRKRQELMAQFIQSRLLPGLVSGVSPTRQKVQLACLLGAVACLLLALARPQWGFSWQEVKQRGVDIVVAIDTSKSMLAEDIAPNRLTRAKLAALDLMRLAKADRLGLVAFAGTAFLECPLTIDDSAFQQSVEALDVNTIPQGGTAVAEAINTALTAFKEKDNHKVLVLMTDGEDHDSGALEAAQKAAQAGLKIYTVGVGTAEGQLLRIKDSQGHEDYVRDEQGNVVKSHLDERLLQEIAGTTPGCFYLPLRGAATMATLYTQGLAALPKGENQERWVRQYQDRYHWPLALACILLAAEILLPERKRQPRPNRAPVPAPAPKPARQRVAETVAVLLLLALVRAAAWASPGSALRDYKSGKYDEALKQYQKLLQRKADDPRLHFNAGTAAYRDGQFEQAAKQFNDALATPDIKLQAPAYYNHGNSLYEMGERNADPSKRSEAWQQAVKDYELSLKLDPKDPDAKYNLEYVKKRLEELKQQQSQQNKSDQNKQDQNKQQQNQQQQSNPSKQDQNQQQQQSQQKDQSQQQQSSQQQQQQQQQQAEQQKQEDQKQQQAASQAQQKPQQPQQAQAAKPGEQSKEDQKQREEEAAYAAGEMTPEQAQQLLDAQKNEEKMLQLKPEGKPTDPARPLKDW